MIFTYDELKECVGQDIERFYKMGFNEELMDTTIEDEVQDELGDQYIKFITDFNIVTKGKTVGDKGIRSIKKYSTEADLIEITQQIDDKVIFRGYNNEQILSIVNEIVKIDLLSLKYETREEILNLLCDIISYYGISNSVNWDNIIDIIDKLEDDLKEYVAEFIE